MQLPANAGGKALGAEKFAMHGLILRSSIDKVEMHGRNRVVGQYRPGNFGGCWLSETELSFEYVLTAKSFAIAVTATNVGAEDLPIGFGWHPYFAIPSRDRKQARLRVPALKRLEVNNYDEVLPTGRVLPIEQGTAYDFSAEGGKELDTMFLDDCYVEPQKTEGRTIAEITDPAKSYGIRIVANSPEVKAMQVYAPPQENYVVYEPQFNWADPFWKEWPPETDTGMVRLRPEQSVVYSVELQLFNP